jgi:hypothetical protein
MSRVKWGTLFGLLAVAVIVGCAQQSDRPKTLKASGTVTYNGSPVEGAVVTFSPTGVGGHAASGTTDASGNFRLSTFESGDGAVPGSYAVSVSKTEGGAQPDAGVAGGGGQDYDAIYEAMEKQGVDVMGSGEGAKAEAEAKDLLPAKYKNPTESGLTAEVTEGGNNTFTFALED